MLNAFLHEASYGFSGLWAFSGNARNVVTNLAKKLLRTRRLILRKRWRK